MQNKLFLKAADICELLEVKQTSAYEIIGNLNKELEEQGYLTLYKEGKNWKVQVYYKDWKGNRKRKQKRGFRTKGEAKEWERDFLQQQSQGVDIEFGNFLEIYYKDMEVRLRESTMSMKRYIIELKIRPYFEKKVLSEITVADIRAWQNELLTYKDKDGKGYAPTYLKTINCQLTAIFNYAIRYYNLPGNPCKKAGAKQILFCLCVS